MGAASSDVGTRRSGIRTARGTRVLDPGRSDTAMAGYASPLIAPGGDTGAWLEVAAAPISDASYPEPTEAWVWISRAFDPLSASKVGSDAVSLTLARKPPE